MCDSFLFFFMIQIHFDLEGLTLEDYIVAKCHLGAEVIKQLDLFDLNHDL